MIPAKKILPAILLLAALVRLAYLAELFPSPFFRHPLLDARYYSEWGRKLSWSHFSPLPDYRGNPLYPSLLAALYGLGGLHPVALRLGQNLFGVLTCLLIFHSGRLLARPAAGLIAAGFYALFVPAIFYEGWFLSASLEAFLAAALLAALLHSRGRREKSNWFLDGILAALLFLARPSLIPLGALIWTAVAALPGTAVRRSSLFIAGAAAAIAVFALFFGAETILPAHGGDNFYIGNNPSANGTAALPAFSRGSPELQRLDFRREAERRAGRSLRGAESSSFWFREGLGFISSYPLRFLKLAILKIGLFFSGTDLSDNYHLDFFRKDLPLLRLPFDWRLLSALGLIGMAVSWRERGRWSLLYIFAAAYIAGIALFFVVSRLRLPLAPLLSLFAGAAVEDCIRGLKSAWWRSAASAAGAGALYLLLGWPRGGISPYPFLISAGEVYARDNKIPEALEFLRTAERELTRQPTSDPLRYYRIFLAQGEARLANGETERAGEAFAKLLALPGLPRSETLFEIANAYAGAGKSGEAAAYYRLVLEEDPAHFRSWNNLGLALKAEGRLQEAEEAIRESIAINPSYAPARGNLGNLRAQRGEWEEAIREFREALRLDPSLAQLRPALAYALQSAGRLTEAQVEYQKCPGELRRAGETR
jgi:tetratricopeptide (TPR) repeat protein